VIGALSWLAALKVGFLTKYLKTKRVRPLQFFNTLSEHAALLKAAISIRSTYFMIFRWKRWDRVYQKLARDALSLCSITRLICRWICLDTKKNTDGQWDVLAESKVSSVNSKIYAVSNVRLSLKGREHIYQGRSELGFHYLSRKETKRYFHRYTAWK
jgi:hypothetical protein